MLLWYLTNRKEVTKYCAMSWETHVGVMGKPYIATSPPSAHGIYGYTPLNGFPILYCTKWHPKLIRFLGYKVTGFFNS